MTGDVTSVITIVTIMKFLKHSFISRSPNNITLIQINYKL
jgi:hypothetical protein